MRILCLQLARLGDIYQTWPVIRALKREYPGATIDLLVRHRFVEATEGLTEINRVIELPTRQWLEQLLKDDANPAEAFDQIERWIRDYSLDRYDRIINLSFSPVASYLVDIFGAPSVSGYTRHSDGYLAIPDDASSYFYAQVGIERSNRIHLSDVFGLVAGVTIMPSDFRPPPFVRDNTKAGIVIQVGASQKKKQVGAVRWCEIIDQLLKSCNENITLIGSASDADPHYQNLPNDRVRLLLGTTNLRDLFQIISDAKLFVGGDSMGQHIAALTGTPALTVSFSSVRFWETGPRSPGSRVIWYETPADCESGRISEEIICMLNGERSRYPIILATEKMGVVYELVGYVQNDFSWELTRALYLGEQFPPTQDPTVIESFKRLSELARLGLQQIAAIEGKQKIGLASKILDQTDFLIDQVGQIVPDVSPLVRWFQTEKLRIGPGPANEILLATKNIFNKLHEITAIYLVNVHMDDQLRSYEWKL